MRGNLAPGVGVARPSPEFSLLGVLEERPGESHTLIWGQVSDGARCQVVSGVRWCQVLSTTCVGLTNMPWFSAQEK